MRTFVSILFLLTVASTFSAASQDPIVLGSDDLTWEVRPSGVRVAVLYGDPGAEGPFALRLEYPAGYGKKPHYHPGDATVTVLSGRYYRGYGAAFDRESAIALTPGTVSLNPAGVSHYEWTDEGASLQVEAVGPWSTTYVDEDDHPVGAGDASRPEQRPPIVRHASELTWNRRPSGSLVAVAHGDPDRPGAFTMRLRLPRGYRREWHRHAQDATVTVLSGSLGLELEGSEGPVTLRPGTFVLLPAGHGHREWATEGEALVDVHSRGPWSTVLAASR